MTAPETAFPAPSLALLDAPLDYFLAEHERHRNVCSALKRIARAGTVDAAEAAALVRFLSDDLVRHHDDEDEIFFPVLRKRALPEDELAPVLERLEADHRHSYALVQEVLSFLEDAVDQGRNAVPDAVAAAILRYAAREYRHLAIENGVVMTIAEVRLTRSDLAAMSRLMKLHRGLPAEAPNA